MPHEFFFNLHNVGWKRTPLVRIVLPSWHRLLNWPLIAVGLLWAYTMLALASTDLRNQMADELVEARNRATLAELDLFCLMNGPCSLRFWGEDGQYHAFRILEGKRESFEIKR